MEPLLGHEDVSTTMIYCRAERLTLHSPFGLTQRKAVSAAARRIGSHVLNRPGITTHTVCGILLLISNAVMVFSTPNEAMLVWCYSLGFLFGVLQAFLGLIGIALLFRDYRRLAEHSNNSNDTKLNEHNG